MTSTESAPPPAVVVTFRNADLVPEMVRGLAHAGLAEVVVVDNASPDDTVAALRLAASTSPVHLRIIENATNDGFGAGANMGMTALRASNSYVLLLNPDARIAREDLEAMTRYLDSHLRCAVVGPRLFDGQVPISSAGRLATTLSELRFVLPNRLARLVPNRQLDPEFARSGPVGAVEGACMLMRRAALEQVGGFDETFFLFFEEHDLAQRLARQAWTMDLCAGASAHHAVGASRDSTPHSSRDHYFASTVRYLERWHGRFAAKVYSLIATTYWQWQVRRGQLNADRALAFRQGVRSALSKNS